MNLQFDLNKHNMLTKAKLKGDAEFLEVLYKGYENLTGDSDRYKFLKSFFPIVADSDNKAVFAISEFIEASVFKYSATTIGLRGVTGEDFLVVTECTNPSFY